jgi:hypothetical protein
VLDFGSDVDQAQLVLSNSGGQPVDWVIAGDLTPFVWSATAGRLAPGEAIELLVGIDRDGLPEGDIDRDLDVSTSGEGDAILDVLARVERTPTVSVVRTQSSLACPAPVAPVVVSVADESAITSVVLTWTGTGTPGSTTMVEGADGWSGRLTPQPVNGTWTWIARATDARGNVGAASAPFVVVGC